MIILTIIALVVFFLYQEGKRTKKRAASDPLTRVTIQGRALHCRLCNDEDFIRREEISGFSVKDLFAFKIPLCLKVTYTCSCCGMIHEFHAPEEALRNITVETEGF